MLFNPAVETVKNGPWVIFFMVLFFGMFGPPGVPHYWSMYFVILGIYFCLTIFLVGVCERYVLFVAMIFFTGVGVMGFLFSSFLYVLVLDFFEAGSFKPVAVGLAPLALIFLAAVAAAFGENPTSSFKTTGNKVSFQIKRQRGYSAGLMARLITLTGGLALKLIGPLNSGIVGVLAGTSGCVALILYYRHIIRGLRTLRIQERNMPTPYTFMQIDEIREARSRWWLGRILKWLASLSRSPSG
ncbi:hypothetical protein EQV97_06045 [Pseudomonas sp. TMW22090]|uniref:hypothetical protein n=1 Tax=Pseudomonas sp. TMW22090 TaxID=2506434 RepID=UPI001F107DFD|nr:hypothetical protein [Pseudomonas sp. TMW22090]MCH4876951.1 hypothetical protein [Pseudomonas sp. TMW22090]